MKAKDFIGKEVLDVAANRIGKVADIELDIMEGVVYNVIVKAGLAKKYTLNLDQIDRIGDRVILKVAEDDL